LRFWFVELLEGLERFWHHPLMLFHPISRFENGSGNWLKADLNKSENPRSLPRGKKEKGKKKKPQHLGFPRGPPPWY
jgi:hypothetical protein